MSDNYLRLIPAEPKFVPTTEAQLKVEEYLRKIASKAERVKSIVYQGIQFIDGGSNWEGGSLVGVLMEVPKIGLSPLNHGRL